MGVSKLLTGTVAHRLADEHGGVIPAKEPNASLWIQQRPKPELRQFSFVRWPET